MGTLQNQFDIIALVKKYNGCVELTKDLYKEIYGRKRLTQSFLLKQKKLFARHGIDISETNRESLLFSSPRKIISDRFTYNERVRSAELEQQAEEYDCRICDVKLYQALETVFDLVQELDIYKNTEINFENTVRFVFNDALNQYNQFYLGCIVDDVMGGLSDVNNNNLKPAEFISQYEEFYDDIRQDAILECFDLELLEYVNDDIENADDDVNECGDDRDNVPVILGILAKIKAALAEVSQEIYLNYIDTPFSD